MATRIPSRAGHAAAAACLAVGFLSSLAVAAADPIADADWQTHALAEDDSIKVRLKVKRRATPADQNFLRLEFQNAADAPVRIEVARYRIERQTFDLASGRAVDSGSLGSGSTFDLFPHAWETTPVSPILLQPAETYVIADHPSDYATALLGMPPPKGRRVEARAHLTLVLADGRTLETAQAGVPVVFEWLAPDEQGLAALLARLKKLIAEPPTRVTGTYVLSMLLKAPAISGKLTVDEVVAGLRRRTGQSLEGRDYLAQFVNRAHPNDPKVVEFYDVALRKGDWAAAEDLARHAPAVWSERFIQPLVDMATGSGAQSNLQIILEALNHHPRQWQGDAAITGRLSAAVRDAFSGPGDVAAMDEDMRREFMRTIELLGMTRDRDTIRRLQPLLDSDVVLFDPNDPRLATAALAIGGPMAPLRARDVAAASILKILGRDAAAGELLRAGARDPDLAAPAPRALRPDRKATFDDQFAARDKRIAALREELANPLKDKQ